ncbi:MAG: hypothetical protein JO290_05450 [Sphingomonadaceae bacterium]|nr:hypothetical protein [Sphingomonadaceae bacterium]
MAVTKVFKSGNSVAVRLPAAFKAIPGTPVEVREEQGRWVVEPVEKPKKKFNVGKVAGSAMNLQPVTDRSLAERPLAWPLPRPGDEA